MNLNFKKKGSTVIDTIFIIVVLVALAIGFFFIKLIFNEVNTDLVNDQDLTVESREMLSSSNDNYTNWADASIGFLFFGLLLAVLITSFLIDSHPIFFVASIIMFIFIIFVAGNVGNLFYDTIEAEELTVLQADFPITMFIMDNLILLIVITFTLTLIILYGKSNGLGGGEIQ